MPIAEITFDPAQPPDPVATQEWLYLQDANGQLIGDPIQGDLTATVLTFSVDDPAVAAAVGFAFAQDSNDAGPAEPCQPFPVTPTPPPVTPPAFTRPIVGFRWLPDTGATKRRAPGVPIIASKVK